MASDRREEVFDLPALRMREATIAAGVWLTYAVGGLGLIYAGATWERPHRFAIAGLFAVALVVGVGVSLLPRERIVRSRFREPFFLTWSVLDLALIVMVTFADGGASSPLVLILFLPVVFAAMSYPLPSVAAVGLLSVASYLGIAFTSAGSGVAYQFSFAAGLLCTTVMSAWQARNHDRQREALAEASRTDHLTGRLNRRGFQERAAAEIAATLRRRGRCAVVVMDIDHFKPVNDRYGHAAGDELLCWVAHVLRAVVRPVDAIGRLGGDEFAILLPESGMDEALACADRVLRSLSPRAPVSLGVAAFPDDGSDLDELIRQADLRLYASRHERRSQGSQSTRDDAGDPPAQVDGGFWRATLDSLATGVAVLDEHGVVIAANAGWQLLLTEAGEPADCIGTNYLEACAASGEPARARVADALATMLSGERESVELEYSAKRGSRRRWFSMRVTRYGGPGPLRLVVTHEDVSEGRQAREQAQMQAALLDQIEAAVVVTDMEGVVMHWSRGAEVLYGWAEEEAVGRSARALLRTAAERGKRFVAELRRAGSWDGEFLVHRKDGTSLTVHTRTRLIHDEDGVPSAIVGVSVDISERVEAEFELVQSLDYAQAVAECMGEGLFTLDVEGRVTYINPAAEEMLGYERGELCGRVMHDLIHTRQPDGSSLAFHDCPISRSFREGVKVRIEDDLFTRSDGGDVPVSYTATPLGTGRGVAGCVVVFQDIRERKRREASQVRDSETLACINRVEDALAEDRFVLYAQPIIDLRTGETVQHELLLRMREADGAIVGPGEFLAVAEKYALIGEIDWWVIRRAVQIAAAGSAVELNLSARSIGDVDVLEHIERSIAQAGAPPANIVFEITETAIVEDEEAARRFAERLHVLGCRIALDDFGTGYGGFTYLKQIPVDYLKIDIEFVRDLAINAASHHVVQAVVALARDFGVRTVAEGVEDERTLDLLRELEVDFAQGYHIARPAPFDERPGDRARAARPRRTPRRSAKAPKRAAV